MKQYRLHNLTLVHNTCRYPSYLADESLQVGPTHVGLHVASKLVLHSETDIKGTCNLNRTLVQNTCRYSSYLADESFQVGPTHVGLHVGSKLVLHNETDIKTI